MGRSSRDQGRSQLELTETLDVSATDALYDDKTPAYFASTRYDYVEALPDNPTAVMLEIGCGEGATAALARERGKCGIAYGVELVPRAGAIAASVLDHVIIGDVEEIDFPWDPETIDILVLSEVLEHLRDPWKVLSRVRLSLKHGALVFASSPNVSHHRIIRALLRGRWDLTEYGPMDRTHLRWFTPASFRDMFQECGYAVDSVGPFGSLGPRSKVIDVVTRGRLTHLLHVQVDLRAHVSHE